MAARAEMWYRESMQSGSRAINGRALSSSGAVKHILLVEDDPDLTVVMRDYLEAYSYRVTTVANGVDGLKAIADSDFDAVLCDLVMPKIPGDMFYQAVQRVRPHLCERFIFVTGHGEHPRVQEFLNQVSEMVLMKPFHLDDLLETILLLFRDLESPVVKLAVPEGNLPLASRGEESPVPQP